MHQVDSHSIKFFIHCKLLFFRFYFLSVCLFDFSYVFPRLSLHFSCLFINYFSVNSNEKFIINARAHVMLRILIGNSPALVWGLAKAVERNGTSGWGVECRGEGGQTPLVIAL